MKHFITLLITILILSILFSCNKHTESPLTKSPCKLLTDSSNGVKGVYSYDAANNLVNIKYYYNNSYDSRYSFIYTNGMLSALNYYGADNSLQVYSISTDKDGNIKKVIDPNGDSLTYGLSLVTIKDYLRKNWVLRSDKINSFNLNGQRVSLVYKYDGNGNATEGYDPDINWLNFKPIPVQTSSFDNKPSPYSFNTVLNWYNSFRNDVPNSNNNLINSTNYFYSGIPIIYTYNDKGLPSTKTDGSTKTYFTYDCK